MHIYRIFLSAITLDFSFSRYCCSNEGGSVSISVDVKT